jgi:hypothetical protein
VTDGQRRARLYVAEQDTPLPARLSDTLPSGFTDTGPIDPRDVFGDHGYHRVSYGDPVLVTWPHGVDRELLEWGHPYAAVVEGTDTDGARWRACMTALEFVEAGRPIEFGGYAAAANVYPDDDGIRIHWYWGKA